MREQLLIDLESGRYEEAKKLLLCPFAESLRNTHQDPVWHGEDDVLTHTEMVVDELLRMEAFASLEKRKRDALFCAAVLHDIGKIECTRLKDGAWTSPHHAGKGTVMARQYLWRDLNLAGNDERMRFRETVCRLIRYHDNPLFLMQNNDPERRVRKIAADGELAPDFSMQMLYLLSKADVMGRICGDRDDALFRVDYFAELCKACACFEQPYPFPTPHTAFSYLSGKRIQPDQPFYDDTWGEVVLLCGLPGTGKDTYIRGHFPELPMVSSDEIRKEFGFSSTGNQTPVFAVAEERAKAFLRARQPFVWNATNITDDLRRKWISLFTNYGASVRIVYLETGWDTCLTRNAEREAVVPVPAIERMFDRLIVPERFEASSVEWIAV